MNAGPLVVVVAVASLGASPLAAQSPIIVTQLQGASGLANPVALANAGDGSGRLFIVLQEGRIVIHSGTQVLPTSFLDIHTLVQSGGEQGLLGLAFHPDYPVRPYFFINYTCKQLSAQPECTDPGDTIIARYEVSDDRNVADPSSRKVLLVIPEALGNHNAGDLKFGPDGNLWIPMGDGGGDFFGTCLAQSDHSLRGKLLRIDVKQNVETPPYYGIPPDNPYVGAGDPPDEVYARGLRNPYRFSFDRLTGDLFLGDVGENLREEIDFQAANTGAGANYGWKVMEGTLCTGTTANCAASVPPCGSPSFTNPIFELEHSRGACAVIGGFRYRGSAIPTIYGKYLYTDLCDGGVLAATEDASGVWTTTPLTDPIASISSFGEDENGEIYFTSLGSTFGAVYRILAAPSTISINDTSVVEDTLGLPPNEMVFTVSLSAPIGHPVTVHYETVEGTAAARADYSPVEGDLTFEPTVTSRIVAVPVLFDSMDEDDETFRLVLSNPVGGTLSDAEGEATILDNDPLPTLFVLGGAAGEGYSGTTPCEVFLRLQPASGRTVSASFQTVDGTATAGRDYLASSGALTFAPGETKKTVFTSVLGDAMPEANETFSLDLAPIVNATAQYVFPIVIVDDDTRETGLDHGMTLSADLLGGRSLHRISQLPFASYEVVIDSASGNAVPGLTLDRVADDGSTVLQSSVTTGTGTVRSLRWQNSTSAILSQEQVRVSATCATGCGTDVVYRLRAYETTGRIARFNNSASQVTVVILQNTGASPAGVYMHFWNVAGALLASVPFAVPPLGSSVFLSFDRPELQGQSGSITVTHDAPYGVMTGKAVALEPATGFSFDAAMTPRPH